MVSFPGKIKLLFFEENTNELVETKQVSLTHIRVQIDREKDRQKNGKIDRRLENTDRQKEGHTDKWKDSGSKFKSNININYFIYSKSICSLLTCSHKS